MIELPESYVLADQIKQSMLGKVVMKVTANASPHKFAAFAGNPDNYQNMLAGKKITDANPGTGYTCGGNTEIFIEDMLMVITTPIKYHATNEKLPHKHQLLIDFEDGSHMSCTVQMWGAMYCYPMDENWLPDDYKVSKTPSPLSDAFDEAYFTQLMQGHDKLSTKALLATEQRIPGLGNGVLQDILFHAGLHPKRRVSELTQSDKQTLYLSVKNTLHAMASQGGRDTERDLFGHLGGYQTILSKKTVNKPCPQCGDVIIRSAYLGGNIYYCPTCQPLP